MGLRRKTANEKVPEIGMAEEKTGFLALCLNFLPKSLGVRTLFTFYSHEGKSRSLHKQNCHLPWAYALSNSKKRHLFAINFSLTWARLNAWAALDQSIFQESMGLSFPFNFCVCGWKTRVEQDCVAFPEIRKRTGAEHGVRWWRLSVTFLSGAILPCAPH